MNRIETENGQSISRKRTENVFFFLFPLAVALLFAFVFPNAAIEGVRSGLSFFSLSIFPSVFPFMILADFMLREWDLSAAPHLVAALSRFLRLSECGVKILAVGLFSGFPVGTILVRDAYEKGAIEKEEAERLFAFANNPSPGFVIGGIGLGMLQSRTAGVILFLSVFLSSVCVCLLVMPKKLNPVMAQEMMRAKTRFSLASSIEKAARSCITVCGFTVFFRMIVSLCGRIPLCAGLRAFLYVFLEIGSAAEYIAKLGSPGLYKLLLLSFSLGFSGLSVFLQVRTFLKGEISDKRYIPLKLLQGVLSAVICFILYTILGSIGFVLVSR